MGHRLLAALLSLAMMFAGCRDPVGRRDAMNVGSDRRRARRLSAFSAWRLWGTESVARLSASFTAAQLARVYGALLDFCSFLPT